MRTRYVVKSLRDTVSKLFWKKEINITINLNFADFYDYFWYMLV